MVVEKPKSSGYSVELNSESVKKSDLQEMARKNFLNGGVQIEARTSSGNKELASHPSSSTGRESSKKLRNPVGSNMQFEAITGRLFDDVEELVDRKKRDNATVTEESDDTLSQTSKLLLSFPIKTFIIKALLIIAVGASGYWLWLASFPNGIVYENIFFTLSPDRHESIRTAKFIKFIVARVKNKGFASVDGKWVADIPPAFKRSAGSCLVHLGLYGYDVTAIYAKTDTPNIYYVECLSKEGTRILIEVAKVKISGRSLFRLLRIY